MPTYDYACASCGSFESIRAMARRDEPATCPECGAASPRVFIAAPRLALLADGTRSAMAINERARHEPKSSADYARVKHPAGCGCCSTAVKGATVKDSRGNKAFPSKRPWMISH
jgi:putative FmdB family regulatory protein